jgi:hypothetical protein
VPPSETGGSNMCYSRAAAAVPTPGRHTLVACMSVIHNFPMGVGGFEQKCHRRWGA